MTKSLSVKNVAITVGIVLVLAIAFGISLYQAQKASAAGLAFATACKTASATTTLSYLSAGAGTTTLPCVIGTDGMNRAIVKVQFTGSSTVSRLNIAMEYSDNNVDWYSDRNSAGATTTQAIDLSVPTTYALQFASTTVGGAAGTASITARTFQVDTVAPMARAVITMPAGSQNGGVWAEITGQSY